jgi:hypothetical protein
MNDREMLLEELERYRTEKDQIRRVLGQIGGISSPGRDRLINVLFLTVVVVLFDLDLVRELLHLELGGFPHFLSTQLALFLISLKIVWMIHRQTRVDHFQFWILHSIEFQINLLSQRLRELEKVSAGPSRQPRAAPSRRAARARPPGNPPHSPPAARPAGRRPAAER